MTLQRFHTAQEAAYDRAVAELQAGAKRSHWMWFVFPQVAGLGRSSTAQHYALDGLAEARDYLADPLLGLRLRQCCEALLGLETTDPVSVLGPVDALKLRSSMTLFAQASGEQVFTDVLETFYGGVSDQATLALL